MSKANTNDRMKTVVINGVPYRMRADMKLPMWRSQTGAKHSSGNDADPFLKGHRNYLTTPQACAKKREKFGDGVTFDHWTGKRVPFQVVEEQLDLLPAGFEGLEEVY